MKVITVGATIALCIVVITNRNEKWQTRNDSVDEGAKCQSEPHYQFFSYYTQSLSGYCFATVNRLRETASTTA